jgi:hypothetical protein
MSAHRALLPAHVVAILRAGLVLAALKAPLAVGVSDAAAWTDGPCPTASGVTVVVDFQDLGGGAYVRCAPGDPTSGFDALQRAGIDYQTTVRFPGFLCRIAGKPEHDPSGCATTSPATAYWSYWIAPRGGSWCYSNWGAGARNPPEGTVEGWSFSLNRSASTSPAPRVAPPPPVAGAPGGLPGGDCDRTATAPTAPPPTVAPPGPAGHVAANGTPAAGSPAGSRAPTPAATAPAAAGPTTTAPAGGATPTTTAAPAPGATVEGASTTQAPAAGAAAGTSGDRDGSRGDHARDEVAVNAKGIGSVDLGSSGHHGGSPIGVLVAVVLIVAAAGTALVLRRRTRATA